MSEENRFMILRHQMRPNVRGGKTMICICAERKEWVLFIDLTGEKKKDATGKKSRGISIHSFWYY
jgi:hypothetical protein